MARGLGEGVSMRNKVTLGIGCVAAIIISAIIIGGFFMTTHGVQYNHPICTLWGVGLVGTGLAAMTLLIKTVDRITSRNRGN